MGSRAWLTGMTLLTLGCNGVISDRDAVQRNLDGGTEPDAAMDSTPDGSIPDGSIPDASLPDAGNTTDAGADLDAGVDLDAGACSSGPLSAPLPNCHPAPPPSTGDDHADCLARINQLRWECQCLPPIARWTDGEACADDNAQYDSANGVHASFYDQPCGTGARAQNECPGWSSTDQVITGCLQAMWDEGPEDGDPNTVNGHYESMASTSYTRVACGFYTTPSGGVWAVQNFD
jgi:hypothetical protein